MPAMPESSATECLPMRRVFVLGDSISIYYGPELKRLLAGRFIYGRKGEGIDPGDLNKTSLINGGDSGDCRRYLENFLPRTDLLLWNCGLHDIKTTDAGRQVELPRYRENLAATVPLILAAGIQLVWIETTPVEDARHNRLCTTFRRFNADVLEYNAAAREIMRRFAVPVIDLYTFTSSLGGPLYRDHVHFTDQVAAKQAGFIAGQIE